MSRLNLILLPGMDGTGELFAPFLAALPDNWQPFVARYPNEPVRSYHELHSCVWQAIPPGKPFALIAESFSGPLAIKIAASHPRDLKALILCATFVENPLPLSAANLGWLINPIWFRLRPPRSLLRFLLLDATHSESLATELQRLTHWLKPETLAARIRLVVEVSVGQALRECQLPILYMHASRDRLVGRRCLNRIRQLNPKIEIATLNTAHLILQCEPLKSVEAISEFLRRNVAET